MRLKTQSDVLEFLTQSQNLSDDEQRQMIHEYVEYEMARAVYEVEVAPEKFYDAVQWAKRRFVFLFLRDSTVFCFQNKADADMMQKHWGRDD